MKFFTVACVAALAGSALAFPKQVRDAIAANPGKYEEMAKRGEFVKRLEGIAPTFDAEKQYVDVSGEHKWVAPGPTDQRGPCPGLNAFANHGFLPHNGIATIDQFIEVTGSVVGMGPDLGAFLAIYGAAFDGDLTKWSIGGPDSRVGVPLLGDLGVLGKPKGISGSHNKYESDVSFIRGDLFQYGNDYEVVLDQFTRFYALQADVPVEKQNYDLGTFLTYRVERFQESLDKNPHFFNNFFSGLLVAPADKSCFLVKANITYLDGEVLKSWFGIEGDYPNFSHNSGYERIPDNWYRRAYGDEYTIPFFLRDVIAEAVQFPQFLDIGGNTKGVNTFTGVDLVNLTQGLYSTKTFLEDPQTFACFIYQMLYLQSPDLLFPLTTLPLDLLNLIQKGANVFIGDFTCPGLDKIQNAQFKEAFQQFPGYTELDQKTGAYN